MNAECCRRTRFSLIACLTIALAWPASGIPAVPKAAEHEDDEVSFGTAVGTPPKAGAKTPAKPTAAEQPARAAAGKPRLAGDRSPRAAAGAGKTGKVTTYQPETAAKPRPATRAQDKVRSKAVKK